MVCHKVYRIDAARVRKAEFLRHPKIKTEYND